MKLSVHLLREAFTSLNLTPEVTTCFRHRGVWRAACWPSTVAEGNIHIPPATGSVVLTGSGRPWDWPAADWCHMPYAKVMQLQMMMVWPYDIAELPVLFLLFLLLPFHPTCLFDLPVHCIMSCVLLLPLVRIVSLLCGGVTCLFVVFFLIDLDEWAILI